MHAMFVTVSIDPAGLDEAMRQLQNDVVPRVKQAPGLVAAYWTAPQGGKGRSVVIFESESTAQQAVEMVNNQPRPEGVTIESVETLEIIASA
jgi:hypothetical protein